MTSNAIVFGIYPKHLALPKKETMSLALIELQLNPK